jgi:glycosyltransferase involved in cell wall biosynthesis
MKTTSMNPEPLLISVIIPVYNGEAFLKEAIQNIEKQDYNPIEIIIVDDGSTDRTADIAASLGDQVRYIFQSNCGPAAARNKGLEIARGSVIAFLDVDDLWTPNKLELQLSYLRNNACEVVLGRVQIETTEDVSKFGLDENPVVAFVVGCGIFSKSVFDRIGGFDVTLRYSEDKDWFLRAREQGAIITILPEVTLIHRRHQNNMTRKQNIHDLNVIKVLRKSLARRRQTGNHSAIPLSDVAYADQSDSQSRNYL